MSLSKVAICALILACLLMGTSPVRPFRDQPGIAVGGQSYPTTAKLNHFNNAERVVEFPIGEQSRAPALASHRPGRVVANIIADENRMRSPPSPTRSRTRGH